MRDSRQGMKRRWRCRSRNQSGQALIEFVLPALFLILLLFGLLDFAIAIYYRQVMINVSREGSNIAARLGASTPAASCNTALVTVVSSASPLIITNADPNGKGMGRVIVSAVAHVGANYSVIAQASAGGLTSAQAPSKLREGVGTVAISKLPPTSPVLPAGHSTLFVTEVYYRFKPASPLGGLVGFVMTNQLYDAAYF